jgi:hypothetical protein
VLLLSALDGTRPSGTLEWMSPVIPVVTQAAVGAGHWAAGRRQRALAAWASAACFALMAWGLGTEAPTRAEREKNIEQQKDLLRGRGMEVPATAGTTPAARLPPDVTTRSGGNWTTARRASAVTALTRAGRSRCGAHDNVDRWRS